MIMDMFQLTSMSYQPGIHRLEAGATKGNISIEV